MSNKILIVIVLIVCLLLLGIGYKHVYGAGTITGGVANLTTATGTVGVGHGGTGITSTTAYGVVLGGTTTTGAFQNAGAGVVDQVLISNGPSAVPTWQTITSWNYEKQLASGN
jgi:hypothetical protein